MYQINPAKQNHLIFENYRDKKIYRYEYFVSKLLKSDSMCLEVNYIHVFTRVCENDQGK